MHLPGASTLSLVHDVQQGPCRGLDGVTAHTLWAQSSGVQALKIDQQPYCRSQPSVRGRHAVADAVVWCGSSTTSSSFGC